jgi:hypothetical protein
MMMAPPAILVFNNNNNNNLVISISSQSSHLSFGVKMAFKSSEGTKSNLNNNLTSGYANQVARAPSVPSARP